MKQNIVFLSISLHRKCSFKRSIFQFTEKKKAFDCHHQAIETQSETAPEGKAQFPSELTVVRQETL